MKQQESLQTEEVKVKGLNFMGEQKKSEEKSETLGLISESKQSTSNFAIPKKPDALTSEGKPKEDKPNPFFTANPAQVKPKIEVKKLGIGPPEKKAEGASGSTEQPDLKKTTTPLFGGFGADGKKNSVFGSGAPNTSLGSFA